MLDNLHDSSPQLSPPGRSNKSQHASAQANFSMHRLTSADQDHLVQQECAILKHLRWILRCTHLKPLYSPMFSAHIRILLRPLFHFAGFCRFAPPVLRANRKAAALRSARNTLPVTQGCEQN